MDNQNYVVPVAKPKVKFEGVLVANGDLPLIVPALTVGQIEKLTPKLTQHDKINPAEGGFPAIAERLLLRAEIIAHAVRRNYPEFTDDDAKEFVTGDNSDKLLNIVLGMDRTSPKVRQVGEE